MPESYKKAVGKIKRSEELKARILANLQDPPEEAPEPAHRVRQFLSAAGAVAVAAAAVAGLFALSAKQGHTPPVVSVVPGATGTSSYSTLAAQSTAETGFLNDTSVLTKKSTSLKSSLSTVTIEETTTGYDTALGPVCLLPTQSNTTATQPTAVTAQTTAATVTFSDPNFEAAAGLSGAVTAADLAAVTDLQFNGANVKSFADLKYFPNLKKLNIQNVTNPMPLDLSNNPQLTAVWCMDCAFTSLDVSQNAALTDLLCYNNQLKTLDVSQNLNLKTLVCSGNQLTSLDVSQNAALSYLDCRNNPLTSLDVSHNAALENLFTDPGVAVTH